VRYGGRLTHLTTTPRFHCDPRPIIRAGLILRTLLKHHIRNPYITNLFLLPSTTKQQPSTTAQATTTDSLAGALNPQTARFGRR